MFTKSLHLYRPDNHVKLTEVIYAPFLTIRVKLEKEMNREQHTFLREFMIYSCICFNPKCFGLHF